MATTGHHSESSPLLYRNATCRNNRNWWAIALVGSLAAIAVVGMACILLLVGIDSTHTIPKRERHDLEHPSVGRFVHITDLHVDPLYVSGATAYSQCHRQQKGTDELTGTFGRAQAKCDSPVALINATSEYLRRRWRDNVDFVIWTGDSGRHDNDAEEPRTFREIAAQNAIAAQSLRHAFPSTPLVPNVGNNDVSPHNELPGPGHKRARRTFAALAEAWSELVPEDQQATFRHGGYFARDVTSRLTALSLNTMYWYRANAKVGGCRAEDSPGLAQLAWLRFQVNRARRRDRGLLILGHVAPSIDNYRPSCLRAYARTVGQAVPPPLTSTGSSPSVVPIIAQLFGHSNINSWAFIAPTTENDESAEDQRLWWERQVDDEEGRFGTLIRTLWTSNSTATSAILANLDDRDWESMEDDVADGHTTVPGDFVDNLLRDYEQILMQSPLPSHMGVTIISPSIVPKLLPAFRVFHYLNSPSPLWSHLPAGTLLDYDVYTANLYAHNAGAPRNVADFFQRLYRFSDAYAINDLSLESYVKWARKLLTSRALRKRFRALTFLDT